MGRVSKIPLGTSKKQPSATRTGFNPQYWRDGRGLNLLLAAFRRLSRRVTRPALLESVSKLGGPVTNEGIKCRGRRGFRRVTQRRLSSATFAPNSAASAFRSLG